MIYVKQIILMIISDNLINIVLKKVEFSQKDKIDFLLKDINNKNIKINALNLQMKEMKENYDNKIILLEKSIHDLMIRISNLEKNQEKMIINPKFLYDSNIFINQNEIDFIFKAISQDKKISLKLLFSSKINGENVEDLKSAYSEKNDILFLIKSKKEKRFGGYAHESFKLSEFEKDDQKAFLFSLDKGKIYKSKNYCSIWKNSQNINSINFGGGVDLKIYHKFISEKNQTRPNSNLYYEYGDENEEYALNGEKYFDISILEVFKVNFV